MEAIGEAALIGFLVFVAFILATIVIAEEE